MDKPLVTPSDELQPDDGEQFDTPILTVDTSTYQVSLTWPGGKQPAYVQMSSELFIEWNAMMNAQRRLLDLVLPAVDAGVYWPGRIDAEAEIARLKQELRFG